MRSMTSRAIVSSSSREAIRPGDPLTVVTICLDDDTRGLLQAFVERAPVIKARTHLVDYRVEDHESIIEWIGEPSPDICLVDFDKNRQRATIVAEKIHANAPGTAIFAVSSQSQPDSIIQAMRSGCSEYLVKPIDREQLLNAIARVAGRKKERKDTHSAHTVAFLGAKGGCGVTTLATQLGALLANSHSRKVLLVDFHRDVGEAALYLRHTNYRYHTFELLENTDRLDAEFLQSFVLRHSSGLDLIPAPEGTEPPRPFIAGSVSQTIDFLRLQYEFILADLPCGLSNENLEVIRSADQLYLVAVAEVSAVRNVVRYQEYLTKHHIPEERVRIIINRHHKRNLITDEQIEKVTRKKIFWRVPNQYAQVVTTINAGDPIAQLSSSDVTRNVNEWAAALGGRPDATARKKDTGGILGLWSH